MSLALAITRGPPVMHLLCYGAMLKKFAYYGGGHVYFGAPLYIIAIVSVCLISPMRKYSIDTTFVIGFICIFVPILPCSA